MARLLKICEKSVKSLAVHHIKLYRAVILWYDIEYDTYRQLEKG